MLNYDNIKSYEIFYLYKWIVVCDMIFLMHINFE